MEKNQNSKAKRYEFQDRDKIYSEIHQEIAVFEHSLAVNQLITMKPSLAHE